MTDGGAFEIPPLEKEEILECLQMGILGEGATNILMEHLDYPKTDTMMQLCVSMLSKHQIEARTLTQPIVDASLNLRYPALYINAYKITNVSLAVRKLIPTLGMKITIADFTTPKPKRFKNFVAACINYFRMWEKTVPVFDGKYSVKERGTKTKEELQTQVELKRRKDEKLKSWLAQNKPRTQRLKQEVEVLREDEKRYLKIKEERDLLRTKAKSKYHQDTVMLEKLQEILSCVSAENEKLLQKVVTSPARHKEKMDQAVLKLKLAEDKKVETVANLREVEKKTTSLEIMSKLLGEVTDTLRDNLPMRDSVKQIQSDNRSTQFKTDHQKMSAEAVRQRARDARDAIATYQVAISGLVVRMRQRQAEFEQAKEELEREKNIADSVKDKHDKEVAELERETETYRKRLQDKEREAEACKSKFESLEAELMDKMQTFNEDFERKMMTFASQSLEQIEPQ